MLVGGGAVLVGAAGRRWRRSGSPARDGGRAGVTIGAVTEAPAPPRVRRRSLRPVRRAASCSARSGASASCWSSTSSCSACCRATRRAPWGGAASAVPEQLEAFNETYGLDQPLPQQFLTFVQNTLTGDLGISLRYRVPVSDLIIDRMWPTLLLVGTSTILAAVIGIWMGVNSGWRRGSRFDRSVDRLLADAVLDAGVVARPAAHLPACGRTRPAARALPDRRALLTGRRPDVLGRDPRRGLAPDAARCSRSRSPTSPTTR